VPDNDRLRLPRPINVDFSEAALFPSSSLSPLFPYTRRKNDSLPFFPRFAGAPVLSFSLGAKTAVFPLRKTAMFLSPRHHMDGRTLGVLSEEIPSEKMPPGRLMDVVLFPFFPIILPAGWKRATLERDLFLFLSRESRRSFFFVFAIVSLFISCISSAAGSFLLEDELIIPRFSPLFCLFYFSWTGRQSLPFFQRVGTFLAAASRCAGP